MGLGWGFPPTPANGKTATPGQVHNLLVMAAVDQRLAEGAIPLAEGNEGIEVPDLLQKPL
jgi:hypothetical protein